MIFKGLTFGIYPLSVAGTPFGLAVGPEDNYEKIQVALQDLRGTTKTLLPRNYLIYTKEWEAKMLSNADRYLAANLLGDLTLGCGDWTQQQEPAIELDNWLDFIRQIIKQYGSHLASLQITNEPNLSFMEGSKPYILQALVEGVIAAKRETLDRNLPLKIGFGSVPDSPMAVPDFWENLAKTGGKAFRDAVDFVGHNFYVDVFEEQPLDLKAITTSIEHTLRTLRDKDLRTAGIPASVPIRIAENGWPTGKNPVANIERSYEHQAEVLETVIRTIYTLRLELNISHYELFGLRDADSSKEDLFHQFGIMRDDYTPKPAYQTFKKLICELGI
ncbi:hypothetical protein REC12_00300 [Desulfosporosinus sp. PR]|uniref:hypothetical protein n=1 Tax=Candidatus Desulfosporosinus nitrosoreducens TaxID=3401928 RepID=UPI0027E6AB5F|nr:hypothetical protein [Desulfosporosinus sp. PR]MDQ7092035.1 hypothetical protein [Desulfosporosinus sp. PR]